ncbi:histone deacetylase family protein [Dongia soli]|uniref:Histone deacetylase family protein n=1 Tax=Dongia soli TaxID=600628 RepID=A0ABU5EF39_9PROT|nr:histone deacetylase family protein [Dongia soli]MDY0884226.1 histone deacetylase family protein [Dongia soli]
MTTALVTHPACLEHDTGPGHPERIDRLRAVLSALSGPEFAALQHIEAPLAARAAISRVHGKDYVEAVLGAIPDHDYAMLDSDTILSPGSGQAALRAAGATMAAVDMVASSQVKNAFCAIRPPGHHAEATRAMGFCLFNNVAIAAAHARAAHGWERVAVVDFDVHHGNGTQHMFEADPNLFFASTHQMPLYPGTGAARETGCGNICNAPLQPGAGSAEFRAAMSEIILPAVEAFRPDLLLISAGFDAHRADPLANLAFETEDFGWATKELTALADRCCEGRVVSTLEGGYDLKALAESAAAHVAALMAA